MKNQLAALFLLPSFAFAGALDSPAKRETPYTAEALATLYDRNAILASKQLDGQSVQVSGTVYSVDAREVVFQTRGGTDVRCALSPDNIAAASKLKAGSRALITGMVAGKQSYSVQLVNCKVGKP